MEPILHVQGCIQNFLDWVDNEIYAYKNTHSLRSNIKGYGGKTHYTDSQNSDTTAPLGRELCHLQFSFLAISPETFGYTLLFQYISDTIFFCYNYVCIYVCVRKVCNSLRFSHTLYAYWIISQWILEKKGGEVWNGFIWLSVGISGGLL
jgi:hypothetical protein